MIPNGKDRIIYYRQWAEQSRQMPDVMRLRLYDAIISYLIDGGTMPQQNDPIYWVFMGWAQQIERDRQAYEAAIQAKRDAGRIGGLARWGNVADDSNAKQCQAVPSTPKQCQAVPSTPKQCQAVPSSAKHTQANIAHNKKNNINKENPYNIGVKESSSAKQCQAVPSSAITPSKARPNDIEEIAAYMAERGALNARDEANAFYDYHTARGWVMSNGRVMKDWKAAARTWLNHAPKYSAKHQAITREDAARLMAQTMQQGADDSGAADVDIFGGWVDPTKQ